MLRVAEPCVVVGDIHGQYYDLVTLLGMTTSSKGLEPSGLGFDGCNYLFLGDYVDRGVFGVEVVLLLLTLKVSLLTIPISVSNLIDKLPLKDLHASG
jgi:serine/threonine-protein phosphatase 2B catalytic subunit